MRVLIFLFTLFISATTGYAQNEISIHAGAEVLVPADKITFQINLNAEADTPQEAYELHKKREKVLVRQLKKHDIQDKDLSFEPISINKTYNGSYPDKKKRIKTRQSVTLTLDDFDIYEQIQITLIENNFDEFSGNFTSSESEKGQEQALKQALAIAREKAETIATETGVTITGIQHISHSHSNRQPRPMMQMTASRAADNSLLAFDQTVSISANVSVTYKFEK